MLIISMNFSSISILPAAANVPFVPLAMSSYYSHAIVVRSMKVTINNRNDDLNGIVSNMQIDIPLSLLR